MKARVEELEARQRKHKKMKKESRMNVPQALCLSLPIHLEREEIIVLSKQGNILDEGVVKDAIMVGFATSRNVREDAVYKIIRSLESYTARKINVVTYERTRLDNSVEWEVPAESIDLQVRGLVFVIWSSRSLSSSESLEQVDEEEADTYNDRSYEQQIYVNTTDWA